MCRSGVRSVLVHTRTLTSQVTTTRVSPVTLPAYLSVYLPTYLPFDRSIESFVVFAGWLFERSSSSGDGRLVLATVLCWLPF